MTNKKLTEEKIKEIVGKEKPGFEVDDAQESIVMMASASHVEKDAPDLDYLVKKFLGKSKSGAEKDSQSSDSTSESRIVSVRPAGSSSQDSAGTGNRKVIVVSASDEAIVAEQG